MRPSVLICPLPWGADAEISAEVYMSGNGNINLTAHDSIADCAIGICFSEVKVAGCDFAVNRDFVCGG